jgi:hypothetical protein
MDEREELRMRLAHELMKLTRHKDVRAALLPLGEDGLVPLVVALPEDTLAEISRRANVVGGRAHVVIIEKLGDGEARLRVLRAEPALPIRELDGESDVPVSEDCPIGMLLQDMRVGQVKRYHSYDSATVLRFLSDRVEPVPA